MFAIAPTDIEWFKFLRAKGYNSEINFWTPTPWNITGLSHGDKLYFMLKSPIRKIGGYGEFVDYRNMTVMEIWNNFGLKNGFKSKQDLVARLEKYRTKNSKVTGEVLFSKVGCITLSNCKFFDDSSFWDLENYKISFHKNIVKLKYFDEFDPFTVTEDEHNITPFEPLLTTTEKLKKSRKVTERKNQGVFRAVLTSAYSNKCCITGEDIPELLEAAHIQPYIDENSNHVQNGLLLRIDLHKLFDNGLMYIDENFVINISPHVESAYYRNFNGKKINLPKNKNKHPSKKALKSRKFEFRYMS